MGNYMVWLMVGLILLAITIFVHRHTYKYRYWYDKPDKDDKLRFPRWLLLIFIVLAMAPILNVIAFGVGICVYFGAWLNEDIEFYFSCESRWCKSLLGWLTKEV